MAAAGGILRAWRVRFESEPDATELADRLGSVASAVLVGLLFVSSVDAVETTFVVIIALTTLTVALVGGLGYAALIFLVVETAQYFPPGAEKAEDVADKRIIGGFRLTDQAREEVSSENVTIEEVLKGVGFKPERVWTKGWRAIAHVAINVANLMLTIGATVALASVGILIGEAT